MNEVSQKMIGARVRAARETVSWTQEALAEKLGFNDRQTVSDIETGKRALKPQELLTLCDLFDREVDFFVDPFVVYGEAEFSWRAHQAISPESIAAFEFRAGQWIGLLRWLRATYSEHRKTQSLKYSLRLSPRDSYEDARAAAEQLVRDLDLGLVPATSMIRKIEEQLDIPILFVDAPNNNQDSISGATCHLHDLGVILTNRHESEGRRHFDVAHELFHALSWDVFKPAHIEYCDWAIPTAKRIEQLADNFAAAFLMPQSSVELYLDRTRASDMRYLCDVANYFRVAPAALGWRLFNMDLIAKHSCMALQKFKQLLGGEIPPRFSSWFVSMLYRALDEGRLSARKAAKAIGDSVQALSDLFAEYQLGSPIAL